MSDPRELILYPTHKCNHKCFFCRRQQQDYTPPWNQDMQVATVRKALQLFPSIRGVGIAGFGEPLLWDNLIPTLDFLATKDVFVNLITNGSLLMEEFSELSHVNQISVSLNASNTEEHHNITQVHTFRNTIEGIKLANQHLNATVGISFVLHTDNYHNIPRYLKIGNELSVDFIDFHNILPHQNLTPHKTAEFEQQVLTSHDNSYKQFLKHIQKSYDTSRVRNWPTLITPHKCPAKCKSPFISLGVDAREAVSGCRRIMPPDPAYGKLKTEVWDNGHFTNLRQQMQESQFHTSRLKTQFPCGLPCKLCFGAVSG